MIKFLYSKALTSHFESFWSIVLFKILNFIYFFPGCSLNDLQCVNDDYCTVIYNDEFHRFDDVIGNFTHFYVKSVNSLISRNFFFTDTIPRAVDCDRQTAIGLTTLVDRNGRCIGKKIF